MNKIHVLLLSALALMIGIAHAVVDPDELPQVSCSELKFGPMTVQILNVAGDTVTTFSFKPSPTQHVIANGKEKVFHDLQVGEKITIWVSEKRLEAFELPGSQHDHWTVLPPLSNN